VANLPPHPDTNEDTGDDTGMASNVGSPPSTPRWVKVLGLIALVLVLLFVILHLTGGGFMSHTP
jgi:hypothetical protein